MSYAYPTMYFGFFIFGAVIGSFLNVCAYRIPRGESVSYPPSHCPTCGVEIRPVDNIPIVSYLLLGGRCRECRSKIQARYLFVELLTAVLWAATYYHFGLSTKLLYGLFFVTVLIVLSAIDFETKTIPNRILLPATVLSALFVPLYFVDVDSIPLMGEMGMAWAVGGFFAGGGLLYIIAVIAPLVFGKEAMGGGDIKLAAFVGLYLGGYVILALFIGFFLGAMAGSILIATKKTGPKDMVPFGPFIAAGSIITMFFGLELWGWYLGIAGF